MMGHCLQACRQSAMLRPGTLRDIAAASWRAQVSHGFEPRSLDSESRVLTVTPRDQLQEMSATQLPACFCHERRPVRHPGRPWLLHLGKLGALPWQQLAENLAATHPQGTDKVNDDLCRKLSWYRSRAELNRDRWIQSPEC